MAAIELGAAYYFYNPAQTRYFVVNAPTDPNFVGYVSEITGLDDAGVRETARQIAAGNGGIHGSFWKDRRLWTMSGFIFPTMPVTARSAAQELMQGILSQCMTSDGYLTWLPSDGNWRWIPFRKQQPTRTPKGASNIERTFQIGCVTDDHRVFGNTMYSLSNTGATPLTLPIAQNIGNEDASPLITITGPVTNPVIINTTTGKTITFKTGTVIPSGHTWTIDLTGRYPVVVDDSPTPASQYGLVDPLNTDWTIGVGGTNTVTNGNNTFQLQGSGSTGATRITMAWRYAWA